MGQYLSVIEDASKSGQRPAESGCQLLQKVRDYHSHFRALCQNFSISLSQYQQIFGSSNGFSLWEKEQSGKVDALELFTGLAIFSRAEFKQKLKFIFDMFDFNEVRSLSQTDLEYMLICVCNSALKLYGKGAGISSSDVVELIRSFEGAANKRVIITSLFKKCLQTHQIRRFFEIIDRQFPDEEPPEQSSNIGNILGRAEEPLNNITQAVTPQHLSWFNRLSQKLAYASEQTTSSTSVPNWVYGINCSLPGVPFLRAENTIIYAVSCIAVVFNLQEEQQGIYNEHSHKISCLAYNSARDVVASCEQGSFSKVYLWSRETLITLSIIETGHLLAIRFALFVDHGDSLVTVGSGDHNSVLVYSAKGDKLTQSSRIPHGRLMGVCSIRSRVRNSGTRNVVAERMMAVWGAKIVLLVEVAGKTIRTSELNECAATEIVSCCGVYANRTNPQLVSFCSAENAATFIVTGHQNGEICVSLDGDMFRVASSTTSPVAHLDCFEFGIAAASGSELLLFNFSLLREHTKPYRRFDLLDQHNLVKLDPTISFFSIPQDLQGELLILTASLQFVTLTDTLTLFDSSNQFTESCTCRAIDTLFALTGNSTALSILDQPDLTTRMLFCCTAEQRILGINLDTHQVVDVWKVSEKVTSIDCSVIPNGGVVLAFGCKSGKLFIRMDWEETPRCYDCQAEILEVRLAFDSSWLLACTVDSQLYVFTNSNNSFVCQAPRKVHFENECPISMEFCDDNKSFIVCMDSQNLYQFYLPELKHKNVLNDNEPLLISQLRAHFTPSAQMEENVVFPGIIGGDQKPFFVTDAVGHIRCYQNSALMELDCYTLLKGHGAPVARLRTTLKQDLLISLSQTDHLIVEWRVEKTPHKVCKSPEPNLKKQQQQLTSRPNPESLALCMGVPGRPISQPGKVSDSGKAYPKASLNPQYLYGITVQPNCQSILFDREQPSQVILFNSRFVVRLSSDSLEEQIIETPLSKVSCLALSENNELVVGEAGPNPRIYLPSGACIRTTHFHTVLHMAFYESLLYSFGHASSNYSINIHDFHSKVLVGCCTVVQYISKFVLTSHRDFLSTPHARVWKDLNPSGLLGEVTCADVRKGRTANEVVCGNSEGSILMLSGKRLLTVREKAHSKGIVSLCYHRGGQLFMLITAGEDEYIRLWDQQFCENASIYLRSEEIMPYLTEQNVLVLPEEPLLVSSVDAREDSLVMNISNRKLLKVSIQASRTAMLKSQLMMSSFVISEGPNTEGDLSETQNYEFRFQQLMGGFSRKEGSEASIAVHPKLPILATSCSGAYLTFLNYSTKQVLSTYFLQQLSITALGFSPNEKYIVVGCRAGIIRVYELIVKSLNSTVSSLTLALSQSFETTRSPVLQIRFSACSTFFAVSYFPQENSSKQSIEVLQESPRSKVAVFVNKDFALTTQGNYYRYGEFEESVSEPFYMDSSGKYCATGLHFVGSGSQNYLIVRYQEVAESGSKVRTPDSKTEYRVYNLKSKSLLSEQQSLAIDWSNCPLIHDTLTASSLQQSRTPLDQPNLKFTDMLFSGSQIVYGTANGDIILADKNSLLQTDTLEKFIAKRYRGLTSGIVQMESSGDGKEIFVISAEDSCVLQLTLTEESIDRTFEKNANIEDEEVPTKSQFYNYTNNTLATRKLLCPILEDTESKPECTVQLSPIMVVGRRAFDRRKNLFFDGVDRLVYCVGPNIVLQPILRDTTTNTVQEIIIGDPMEHSCAPQISCFTVDKSCELLALATEEEQSQIIIWNVHTRLCLSRSQVNCSIVQGISFSRGSQLVGFYGISKSYYPVVAVLDWRRNTIECQCSLLHSPVWLIKDIQFCSNEQFLSCGVQHLSLWSCSSGNLTFESYDLSQVSNTAFTAVAANQIRTFTSCDNGFIYQWSRDTKKFLGKVQAHDSSIRCLLIKSSQLVSVGMDAKVCTFDISEHHMRVRDQQHICQPLNGGQPESKLFSAKYDIQAVTFAGQHLYVGTRSGDIYQLKSSQKIQILSCSDHEKPIGVAFDADSTKLYILTSSGFLQAWDLQTLRCKSYHFRKTFFKMMRFRGGLLFVLERSISVIKWNQGEPLMQQHYSMSLEGLISDAKLSTNERMLAVATADSDKHELSIYEVGQQGFKLMRTHPLSSQVQFLDFSVDDRFILFKDRQEDIGIVECKELKRINTVFIEYDIEWSSEGRVINEKAMKIQSCYHRENTITKMLLLRSGYVLVADQIGSLRLFDYPCADSKIGQLHLRCYTNHMNNISCLEGSPDGRWVASASTLDRAIILWQVQP